MYISFFKNNNEAIIGTDYSWHNDILHQEDIDFNPETQIAELIENNWKFSIKISTKKEIETDENKYARIFAYFSNPENPLEVEKLEGIEFTDKQIGDLIQTRVFEGNPHAESAMQAKFSAWITSVVLGKPNKELKAEIDAKQAKINEVREFFGLTPLTF